MTTPLIGGVSELADGYRGFVLDVWGVLHEGGAVFPGALDALSRLRQMGKRVVLLSNAPRRAARVAATLKDKGLGEALYDGLITSGDATRDALARRERLGLGPRYAALGPERDASLLDGLPLTKVRALEDADFVLCTGPIRETDALEAYDEFLARMAARRLPLVCANPDTEVVRLGRRELCAGALARRYSARGGPVLEFGKPHEEVYRLCLETLKLDRAEVLALGDGLATDIAGAAQAGIPAVLVLSTLHDDLRLGQGYDGALLETRCQAAGVRPLAALPAFAW